MLPPRDVHEAAPAEITRVAGRIPGYFAIHNRLDTIGDTPGVSAGIGDAGDKGEAVISEEGGWMDGWMDGWRDGVAGEPRDFPDFFPLPTRQRRKYGGRGFIPRCAAAAAAPPSLVFHPLGKNKGTNATAHNRRNIFDARSRAREIDRGLGLAGESGCCGTERTELAESRRSARTEGVAGEEARKRGEMREEGGLRRKGEAARKRGRRERERHKPGRRKPARWRCRGVGGMFERTQFA